MKFAWILTASLLLAACGEPESLDGAWRLYLSRLENVLERDAPAMVLAPFPHYPRQRVLRLQFAAPDIDLLEFLRLRSCKLRETIAERNSILGRHGDAAARLIFDLRFLSQVDECLAELSDKADQELRDALLDAKSIKQRQLPARLFAASLGAAEFRALWAYPERDGDYPLEGEDRAVTALARWAKWQQQWLQGRWQLDTDAVLNTLGEIRRGLGGPLLLAQLQMAAGLKSATALIDQRVEGRPLCLKPSPTPTATNFQGVLQRFFIEGIQRDASHINRHQQQLLPAVKTVEEPLLAAMRAAGQPPPLEYLQWQQRRDGLFSRVVELHRRHVKTTGELLDQCGLTPGSTGRY